LAMKSKREIDEKKFLGIGGASQVKPFVDKSTSAAVTSMTMQAAIGVLVRPIATNADVPECSVTEVSSYPEREESWGE
jgi:hypothetical protein